MSTNQGEAPWLILEAACGNHTDVQLVMARLQGQPRALDAEMEYATAQLIHMIHEQVLKGPPDPHREPA
jgi:hypothetical protein